MDKEALKHDLMLKKQEELQKEQRLKELEVYTVVKNNLCYLPCKLHIAT